MRRKDPDPDRYERTSTIGMGTEKNLRHRYEMTEKKREPPVLYKTPREDLAGMVAEKGQAPVRVYEMTRKNLEPRYGNRLPWWGMPRKNQEPRAPV
jgi:hypothetical protein